MNLHGIANPYVATINPNFTGDWLSSAGSVQLGDAVVTAGIVGSLLTVDSIISGALAIGSLLTDSTQLLLPATTITEPGPQPGTYLVSRPQAVDLETMIAVGPGIRQPGFTTFAGVTLQVQALSAEDLRHVDFLNLQGTVRAIYMNGSPQGVQRPDARGGDLLYIPTGLTPAPYDTWLVNQVLEQWDADGWSKVVATLQLPKQAQ